MSTESTASETITIITSVSGTMVTIVPSQVITTIWTTDANGGTSPVVVTIHQPTGTLNHGDNSASQQFFGNRGAVAGVFSFVGIAIVGLIAGLWYALRRRQKQQRIRRAEQYAAGVMYPVHPLRDDDDYAERMHRRTYGHEMDGSDTPMLALPGTTSVSGHGHFDTTDSSNLEMYEPYAGYGVYPSSAAPSSSLAPYAGIISPPPQYVSGNAPTPTPALAASGRPISPGYAAMPMTQGGPSSHGHGSTSSHDSIGQALMTPYPYSSTGPASSVARDSTAVHEQQEPLLAYAPDVKVRPISPPLPPKNPNRPRPGSIALPPPGLPLPQMRSTTTDSEYPPSAYSADDDARLDPSLAGRLRGGSVLSSSTPSFRDDQDYSRRLSIIRQNTYDSYVSTPGNIPEAEHEPER
ncbi:hypothetical protein BKA62DRAFT_479149 [Auriculariales sp. MPI-PUGE-AT-0066]|nr:hypothetical protein BKA62DRAFT_479149 [Auriculariales sp. MPI-PUGE-AT-0066]